MQLRTILNAVFVWLLIPLIVDDEKALYAQPPSLPQRQSKPNSQQPDWADDFLKAHPLEKKADKDLTLSDLMDGIQDPRSGNLLMRHFRRATLSSEDAERFLRQALDGRNEALQGQAVIELQQRGTLSKIVQEKLKGLREDADPQVADSAELAEKLVALPELDTADYSGILKTLIEQLSSADEAERWKAEVHIRQYGLLAVPLLLSALDDKDLEQRKSAARLLGEIMALQKNTGRQFSLDEPRENFAPKIIAKSASTSTVSGPESARVLTEKSAQTVRVYYGTNRKPLTRPPNPWWRLVLLPLVFVGVILILLRGRRISANEDETVRRGGCTRFVVVVVSLISLFGIAWLWNSSLQQLLAYQQGVKYGSQREAPDVMHFGYCDVSLPPTHGAGELERPLIGPEDERWHVVLQQTNELSDEQFMLAVRRQLAELPTSSHDCFVFVHGFNVTFENAALRTAQISYDLEQSGEFVGVPLFYSWPSAGNPLLYSWDRTEIQNSKHYLKEFLTSVASRVQADRIHVIGHSMGADVLSQAIAEIESPDKLFHQIVLAAPDIDADVFRRELAPALARQCERTTIYCSSNDLALQISYRFNNARRVGDTTDGVFVTDGVDTVDASLIPTDLLGHSYYGDCIPLESDMSILLKSGAPPDSELRKLKRLPWRQLFYWVFGG